MRLSKALTTVLQKEGLRGLYAGNGVKCIRVFPFSAIVCLVYANLAKVRRYYKARKKYILLVSQAHLRQVLATGPFLKIKWVWLI